jgi:curved DNA-binding protein
MLAWCASWRQTSMEFHDYYAVLGVKPDASAEEIKKAYRSLARLHHPDVSTQKDAQQRFAAISEAYTVLSDPAKRREYDDLRQQGWRGGEAPPRSRRAPPPSSGAEGDWVEGFHGADGEGFSDFFQSLFGQVPPRGPRRGQDVRHALTISLEEAFAGGERILHLQLPPAAGRDGPQPRVLTVSLPPGLVHGEPLRLRGQGLPGNGDGPPGDLYLEIAIAPHPFFRVDGRTVLLDVPLAPWEAVLGAAVSVPTLGGPVSVSIEPGSRSGQKLRLKGRGLPGDPPGDQILTLTIAVPGTVTPAARELWRQLSTVSAFDPRRAWEQPHGR